MIYGNNLVPLATRLGISGVKVLVGRHFVPFHKQKTQFLMWSNVPYQVVTKKRSSGGLSITIHRPSRVSKLRAPKLHEVRACFYTLLSVAIVGHWSDNSVLDPEQIRFLMRLSGLKIPDNDSVCDSLTELKDPLLGSAGQNNQKIQKLCQKMYQIFLENDPDKKAEIMLGIIKEESLCNPDHYVPLVTTKHNYLNYVLKRLPIKVQQQIRHEKSFNVITKFSDQAYVAINQNYRWYPLTSQSVINLIDTLIFYLT